MSQAKKCDITGEYYDVSEEQGREFWISRGKDLKKAERLDIGPTLYNKIFGEVSDTVKETRTYKKKKKRAYKKSKDKKKKKKKQKRGKRGPYKKKKNKDTKPLANPLADRDLDVVMKEKIDPPQERKRMNKTIKKKEKSIYMKKKHKDREILADEKCIMCQTNKKEEDKEMCSECAELAKQV